MVIFPIHETIINNFIVGGLEYSKLRYKECEFHQSLKISQLL